MPWTFTSLLTFLARHCSACGRSGHTSRSCPDKSVPSVTPTKDSEVGGSRRRAQREAAVKARTQLATVLQGEARDALNEALDAPTIRQDGVRDLLPVTLRDFSPKVFHKVRNEVFTCFRDRDNEHQQNLF
jgi:hypothetical protein